MDRFLNAKYRFLFVLGALSLGFLQLRAKSRFDSVLVQSIFHNISEQKTINQNLQSFNFTQYVKNESDGSTFHFECTEKETEDELTAFKRYLSRQNCLITEIKLGSLSCSISEQKIKTTLGFAMPNYSSDTHSFLQVYRI